MAFGGNCIGKINGKTVFIPLAVPGEELEIEITQSRRDYDTARIIKVIKPSPHRKLPECPLYSRCGGCNLMHIDEEYQTELRKGLLKETFERNGIPADEIKVISGPALGYRARFQLHDGGLKERLSNHIIPINRCPLAVNEINDYLKNTSMQDRPRGRSHLFGSEIAEPKFIARETEEIQHDNRSYRELSPKEKKLRGKHYIKHKFAGISQNPSDRITVTLSGKKISFDVQGFFQSNMYVLEKAVPEITRGLSGKKVLDMYSGAGTFSVFLADCFEKVTMVEHNRGAMVFAEENMAGKNHESYAISGAQWVKENAASIIKREGNFDAAVIDPPRSGMEKEVCEWLSKSGIPDIRAISCDAATQARDLKILTDNGYSITDIYLLDFYPQTAHIESLVCLKKTGGFPS